MSTKFIESLNLTYFVFFLYADNGNEKEIKRFRDRLHYANISDIAKKEMINKKNMNRSVWKGSVIKSLKSKIFYQG